MKHLIPLFFSLFLLACSQAPSEPETISLSVEGMTCENCAQGITGTLNQTPGVIECSVSLEKESAVVTYDPSLIDAEQIATRINQLGFAAEVPTKAP